MNYSILTLFSLFPFHGLYVVVVCYLPLNGTRKLFITINNGLWKQPIRESLFNVYDKQRRLAGVVLCDCEVVCWSQFGESQSQSPTDKML